MVFESPAFSGDDILFGRPKNDIPKNLEFFNVGEVLKPLKPAIFLLIDSDAKKGSI